MNVSKLSLAELLKLQKQVERAIDKKQKSDAEAARREVEKILNKRGLTMKDVLDVKSSSRKRKGTAAKTTRAKVKPKYANPADKKVTWTGRGRKPLWVQAHLKKGGKIEDLAI